MLPRTTELPAATFAEPQSAILQMPCRNQRTMTRSNEDSTNVLVQQDVSALDVAVDDITAVAVLQAAQDLTRIISFRVKTINKQIG